MLRLKLKELLLSQGRLKPHSFLVNQCQMSDTKAHKLLNNKQKSIAFKDLTKICDLLQCTPNDLFWWEDTKRTQVADWHPIKAKLTKPEKSPAWALRIESLDAESVVELRTFMEELEKKKWEKAKGNHNEEL